MRITQGTFSFLPDLTDEQIEAQLRYALRNGWAIMVEHTDDPHPRNALWEMWGQPMFDLGEDEVDVAMREVRAAREACPHEYVKVVAYDRSLGRQTTALSFIVGRPERRARLPARAPGEGRPPDPLHAALLRDRRSRSAAATRPNGRSTSERQPRDEPDDSRRRSSRDERSRQVLAQLDDDLVALAPVKTRIREIAALLVIDRLRREAGLDSSRPSLHMSFTGNPGTGKTTVALRMAEILHRLGYIEKPKVVSVTRDDLVGQYVGHTAPKTREVLKRAHGGVLFIDEAYYLYRPENERDYGQEAIEILLQVMETERENLVVVLAGYHDRMETFFRSNPGMGSRVAHHIHFPDFDVEELMAIARADARAAGLRAHARGRARVPRATSSGARCGRGSRTAAASATRSTGRACARPAGCTTGATSWTAPTS